MWDGFDKRRFPRINLHCEISIRSDVNARPIATVTENIGMGGVSVILDKPLERFTPCHIRLELDEKLPKIESSGKVMWLVPTRSSKTKEKCFDTGIEFINLTPSSQMTLRKYLEANVEKAAG